MNTNNNTEKQFDEKQIFQTLKTAVATSKKSLMNDGILLICWGLAFSLGFFWKYFQSIVLVPS